MSTDQLAGRNGSLLGAGGGADSETMEQVRELLFGEAQRRHVQQMAALEERLDAMDARIAQLERRIDDLARETSEVQTETLDELNAGIAELGARLRKVRSG